MTALYILLILLAIALAAVFTIRRAIRTDGTSLLFKTIASVGFILLGIYSYQCAKDAASIFILPGLIMGLIGDIYLDLKYVHPRSEAIYTFAGFGAFIVGHIFYLVYMLCQYDFTSTGLIVSLIIGVAAGVGIFLTPALMKLNYGRYHVISAAYAALLVFVTVYALCLLIAGFWVSKLLFFLGIALFLFSDLVLSQIYFGEGKNTPRNSMINHGSYYLGQILIAASVFFVM